MSPDAEKPKASCLRLTQRSRQAIAAYTDETYEVGFLRRHCPHQVMGVAVRSFDLSTSQPPATMTLIETKTIMSVELPRSPRRPIITILFPKADASDF
jgi:hypothetical protein